jgi:hypothetical protein
MSRSMETIGGERLAALPVVLEHVRDIEYFDGPLLGEFRDPEGRPWIYYWCDSDQERSHRWLVLRTTPEAIAAYVSRGGELLDLIRGGAGAPPSWRWKPAAVQLSEYECCWIEGPREDGEPTGGFVCVRVARTGDDTQDWYESDVAAEDTAQAVEIARGLIREHEDCEDEDEEDEAMQAESIDEASVGTSTASEDAKPIPTPDPPTKIQTPGRDPENPNAYLGADDVEGVLLLSLDGVPQKGESPLSAIEIRKHGPAEGDNWMGFSPVWPSKDPTKPEQYVSDDIHTSLLSLCRDYRIPVDVVLDRMAIALLRAAQTAKTTETDMVVRVRIHGGVYSTTRAVYDAERRAKLEGAAARASGVDFHANPYRQGPPAPTDWLHGAWEYGFTHGADPEALGTIVDDTLSSDRRARAEVTS